ANSYVMEEINTSSFYTRFRWLIDRADGYVAMHGGMGTLAEITFAWQKLALDILAVRPFILTGPAWNAIFKTLRQHLTTRPEDYDVLGFADTPEDACRMLQDFFAHGPTVRPGATDLIATKRQ
ncbi:MAG: LOG family protein, partial [Candidatus Binataceae bacterium]